MCSSRAHLHVHVAVHINHFSSMREINLVFKMSDNHDKNIEYDRRACFVMGYWD